ncbi:hypothetical protein Pfo_001443 [Paulownia fortunei]|nr:hypothetical protein Pfo_001443 [Paulownia fortunei]
MEKPSLVSYEQNETTSFYLCRQCRSHLALHQELLHKYVETKHGLFRDLVNVAVGANYPIVTGQTAAPVSCINCDNNLGAKFIALQIETSAIRAGRFMIDMQAKKLLFWKGNQMVYADTEEPVQNA